MNWLFGACGIVGDFAGWLSFERMACVRVRHISRITLFLFTLIWEHGPRFGQIPPPSFSAPAPAYTYRPWKRDLRLWQATSSLQKNPQA